MDTVMLGRLIEGEAHRDAIHMAVAPVIADEVLSPGQHIGFADGYSGADRQRVNGLSTPIGIVDPFLKQNVIQGQRFYMLLFPQTITSLRHDWSHPAFAEKNIDKAAAQKWMDGFAAKHYSYCGQWYHGTGRNYTADELVEYAKEFLLTGDKHVQQGSESLRDDTIPSEFWPNFEAITGMRVADYHRDQVPFCCTC